VSVAAVVLRKSRRFTNEEYIEDKRGRIVKIFNRCDVQEDGLKRMPCAAHPGGDGAPGCPRRAQRRNPDVPPAATCAA
jgi:hypothetical protein